MKALTLTQPWAHLVAIGAKRVETRSWPTQYRGPLAIHAAQGWGEPDRRVAAAAWGYLYAIGEIEDATSLLAWMAAVDGERGSVLGTIELVDCVPTSEPTLFSHDGWSGREWSPRERLFGDFSPGRYLWLLAGTFRPVARPTPAKGALGLWEW